MVNVEAQRVMAEVGISNSIRDHLIQMSLPQSAVTRKAMIALALKATSAEATGKKSVEKKRKWVKKEIYCNSRLQSRSREIRLG